MVFDLKYSFKIDKPKDMKTTFENLRKKIASHGGKLDGDDASGFISSNGVEGKYIVKAECIEITILKKALPLIPNRMVEKEIRNIFKDIAK